MDIYISGKVNFYLGVVLLLIPFGTIVLFTIFMRTYKTITMHMSGPSLVGVTHTGITVTAYVIVMDLTAIFMAYNNHEYLNTKLNSGTFNISITVATFVFDLVVTIIGSLIFIFYCLSLCSECNTRSCSFAFVFIMLGKDKTKDLLDDKYKNNERTLWFVLGLSYVFLFCTSSHFGYILVAYLTEPERTSSIALVALASMLFFFITFRDSYIFLKKCVRKNCGNDNGGSVQLLPIDEVTNEINMLPFIISYPFGLILFVAPLAIFLSAFTLLPIPVIELASYLENIIQVVLVLLAVLISYKLISFKDSDTVRFMKKFRKSYSEEQVDNKETTDEFEKTGKIMGQVFRVVNKKCTAN